MGGVSLLAHQSEGRASPSAGGTRTAAGASSMPARHGERQDPRDLQGRRAATGSDAANAPGGANEPAVSRSRAAARSTARAASSSPSTGRLSRLSPATRSPPRCSPTACISSAARSNITARAASSAPAPRSRTRSSPLIAGAGRVTPNLRATQIELYEGLRAASQNRWPSLAFDLGAVNDLLSPLLRRRLLLQDLHVAGLIGANWAAHVYEPVIRAPPVSAAPRRAPDPDRYAHRSPIATCWSSAPARPASRPRWPRPKRGARDPLRRKPRLGGSLLAEGAADDRGQERARHGSRRRSPRCARRRTCGCMPRTTAFGYYAHNIVGLNERVADRPLADPDLAARAAVAGARAARSCWRRARWSARWSSRTTTGPA